MAIITISRGTLSGGRAVAECLAGRLAYPCVAREVFQDAARALGASEDVVRKKLQAPPGRWDRFTQERTTYVVAVQAALAAQCQEGNLVYHGLAGQFLLRGLRGVLRVRLIAPVEMRIEALLRAHHGTRRRAAERFIRTVDRDRRQWVKLMYDAEVGDPSLYDLTVNLRSLSLDTACSTIAALAEQPPYQVTDEVRRDLRAFATTCRARLNAIAPGRTPDAGGTEG